MSYVAARYRILGKLKDCLGTNDKRLHLNRMGLLKSITDLFGRHELREIDLDSEASLCMLPFVHFHVTQSGNVTPCCQAPWDEPLAKMTEGQINELWNLPAYKELRLSMLNGDKPNVCRRCYEKEDSGWTSLRQVSNSKYSGHYERLNAAWQDQGQLDGPPIYFDIRFSNICNLKCRICGPWASSKWFEDAFEMGMADRKNQTIDRPVQNMADLIEQITELVDGVEEFYFAGGEPLMMEEHYAILDLLIDHGRTDVQLTYNTNFSTLRYKNRDILELWNLFSRVDLAVSLDGSGERLEYMRNPIKWETIQQNFARLKERSSHVNITVSPTISIFNLFHLPEFHKALIDDEWIRIEDLVPTLLIDPDHYNIRVLPIELVQQVSDLYSNHIEWILQQNPQDRPKYEHMLKQFKGVIEHLTSNDSDGGSLSEFRARVAKLDALRGESFSDVFPELSVLVT